MKFEINSRFGGVLFTAEIEANEDTRLSIKLGLAVRQAYLKGAYLKGADLEGAYLKGAYLKGADLEGAYLKGADLEGADLEGAYLKGAYLKGADLEGAYLEGAYLEGAYLEGAYLEGAYLEGAYLKGAYLEGADLEGAYLKGAYLKGADLEGAYLKGAYLKGAYLKGVNLEEIPVIENIHQTVYEAVKKDGALDMSNWHTCETTHCRAGWVVNLAGKAGLNLERQIGTASAAYQIYRKSDDSAYPLNFYASNKDAMSDMKNMAELEAERD